jgi:hypothetical protein
MVLAFEMWDGVFDGVCDGVGDGGRDGVLTLAALVLALMLGYLVGSFRLRSCAGRFQYVWSPKPLLVFIYVDNFSVLC